MRFTLKPFAISLIQTVSRLLFALCLAAAGLSAALPAQVQARPLANEWPVTKHTMLSVRTHFTATLLPTGRVLAAGGYDNGGSLHSAELYNPGAGTWQATGNMSGERRDHTATQLLNGKVLVVGGRDDTLGTDLATAELYNPVTGTWASAAPLPSARTAHTATLLQDGRVLVVGGEFNFSALNSAQIYDPALNSWSATPTLTARYGHTATLLPDGRVMVVGGIGSAALTSIQVYNPADNTWSSNPTGLTTARYAHTTTTLPDGRLLVVGGTNGTSVFKSSELITYAAGSWSVVATLGELSIEHMNQSATLLTDGRVLVAGGQNLIVPAGTDGIIGTGELYDAVADSWSMVSDPQSDPPMSEMLPMFLPRTHHTATLLPGGQVLMAGGEDQDTKFSNCELYVPVPGGWTGAKTISSKSYSPTATALRDGRMLVVGGIVPPASFLKYADLYDPITGNWTPAQDMNQPRVLHTATLLTNGKVLVAGGQTTNNVYLRTAELYDPDTNSWTPTGSMLYKRAYHTATLLPGGQVMVTGGIDPNGSVMDSVEIYDPNSGTWSETDPLVYKRSNHTATLLLNGDVLVVGGLGNGSYLATAEIYQAATHLWVETYNLGAPRAFHTATLLSNGAVLIAGGYNSVAGGIVAFVGCQLYTPGAGWAFTGSLIDARGDQTATLMADGRVLVAGGAFYFTLPDTTKEMRPVSSSEIYDPASEEWTLAGNLVSPRFYHAAALLLDGRVMVVGGKDRDNVFDSAELFDSGIGFNAAWRPQLNPIPTQVRLAKPLVLTGSQLRGYHWLEAASGNASGSATNYPLVQLRRMDNGQIIWLAPDPKVGFTNSAITTLPISNIKTGLAILTVFVNGIPSMSQVIDIQNYDLFLPTVRR